MPFVRQCVRPYRAADDESHQARRRRRGIGETWHEPGGPMQETRFAPDRSGSPVGEYPIGRHLVERPSEGNEAKRMVSSSFHVLLLPILSGDCTDVKNGVADHVELRNLPSDTKARNRESGDQKRPVDAPSVAAILREVVRSMIQLDGGEEHLAGRRDTRWIDHPGRRRHP